MVMKIVQEYVAVMQHDECGVCGGDGSSCGGDGGGTNITDGCDLREGSVFVLSNGDVLYNVSTDIAGFQLMLMVQRYLEHQVVLQQSGFTVSAGGTTVLAFSFTGATISDDCGLLTSLVLAGEASGLSGLVFSDSSAATIDVTYCDDCVEGGDDVAGGIPSEWDNDGDSFFDNINLYQNSGSITSRVFLEGLDVGSEGDALAAFVDGEQRDM